MARGPQEVAWLLAVVAVLTRCSKPTVARADSGLLPEVLAAAAEAWEELVVLGEAVAAGLKTCWPTPAREATTRPN